MWQNDAIYMLFPTYYCTRDEEIKIKCSKNESFRVSNEKLFIFLPLKHPDYTV